MKNIVFASQVWDKYEEKNYIWHTWKIHFCASDQDGKDPIWAWIALHLHLHLLQVWRDTLLIGCPISAKLEEEEKKSSFKFCSIEFI